ncbi:hypothetical protein JRO89_XS08G0142600 [Xanthoceras sorbifolium]|uniref:Dehydrin n=1 Tax=Xanthoceras sorbifolium TaxID=99658 RepID=A0ABQ8HPW0_9ROSI|nr:hypothetical protein JRO89_XS08G0142600 [Xanthoceras sorbifolium]
MAQNQPRGAFPQDTDEYGNTIRQTDEGGYGSYQTGGTTTTGGLGTCTGKGVAIGHRERGHLGVHHDNDGSSSSSSEDEGKGTRKKGIKEKIKEKIPGVGHRDEDRPHYTGTTPGGPGGYGVAGEGQYQREHGHEKKGMMEKIKEKLPGQHGHN